MIGLSTDCLAGIESRFVLGGCGDSKIALSDVHSYHMLMAFRRWVCSLDFKTDEQVELFAGRVIPELGSANRSAVLDERDVLVIACVGNGNTPLEGKDADMLFWFETVVSLEVVGKRSREVLRRTLESLVAFLGYPCLTCGSIVSHLCP